MLDPSSEEHHQVPVNAPLVSDRPLGPQVLSWNDESIQCGENQAGGPTLTPSSLTLVPGREATVERILLEKHFLIHFPRHCRL